MSRPKTVELWRQRLQRFDPARMTVAQFCQLEGVSQASFYKWKKTLRELSQQSSPRRSSPQQSSPQQSSPQQSSPQQSSPQQSSPRQSSPRQSSPRPTQPEFSFVPLRLSAAAENRVDIATDHAEHLPFAPPLASTTIELPGGVRIRVEVPTELASGRSGGDQS